MLIIAGHVFVAAESRDEYVELFKDLIARCREAPGCLDGSITADSVDPSRVNIFELWDNEENLATWRATCNAPQTDIEFTGGTVLKYQISSSGHPFD